MVKTTKQRSLVRSRASKQKSTKGAMKKTTKRGAYAPSKKKAMVTRRNPMVETKRREHSLVVDLNRASDGTTASANYPSTITGQTIVNDDAFTFLNLASYYRNSHGFQDHNCIGDSIFSKYLKLKVQIRWPTGTNMIVNPVKVYLITGWVTAPPSFSQFTNPTRSGCTDALLRQYLQLQLKEYFNSRTDFLEFREKQQDSVKVLRWQKLVPNNNESIAAQPGQIDTETDPTKPPQIRTTGAVPTVNRSFTWKTMKKVHLTEGTATTTGNDAPNPDIQNLYPNQSWLPFALIYNPDFSSMRNADNEDTTMSIYYNDIHYYSDS